MRTHWGIIAAVCWIAGAISPVQAADWPRFRGPNGSGIALDTDIPIQWTSQEVLWKIRLPGLGNSSPIVCRGRVFLQSSSEDGSERHLLCLDPGTGKLLWSRTQPGRRSRTHPKNSLASATPAADSERVYALFWDGKDIDLCSYDYQGNLLWTRKLGGFVSQHGPGTSPIVHANKIFVAHDRDDGSTVLALDCLTGKPLWQASRLAFTAAYATPLVRTNANGKAELVVASTAGVTGYDPDSGSESWNWAWKFPAKSLRVVASPVECGGLIVAQSGDGGGGRHTVSVRAGESDAKASLAWEKDRGMPYVPCPLAWDGHLYFVNDRGTADCLVASTGEKVWSERLAADLPISASPILIVGKIYVVSEDGQVCVFRAAPKFEFLGKSTLGEGVLATPAVADGRLFIRGKTHLFCIGKLGAK